MSGAIQKKYDPRNYGLGSHKEALALDPNYTHTLGRMLFMAQRPDLKQKVIGDVRSKNYYDFSSVVESDRYWIDHRNDPEAKEIFQQFILLKTQKEMEK